MDKKTGLEESCGCDRRKKICIHSTISRSGDLLARRIAASSSHVVNLAKLGLAQAPKLPEHERKVKWLHIDFKSQEDRARFERGVEETKKIYENKLAHYHGEMGQARANHLG